MRLSDKVNIAIEHLKMYEPETEPYYLCYSGGKDSNCIRILAELAGVKHDIVHNLTTVDAPETVQYIKSIPHVIINKARYKDGLHKTMWNLIVDKHMPPTRLVRYCCSELKEQGGKYRMKITGVRKAESVNRNKNGGFIKIIGKPKTVQKYADEISADFERYPIYRDNYIRAFDRMLLAMPDNPDRTWRTGLDVYKWWVGDDPNQLSLFDI